jgi:Type II secretion system (T2SS), protein E, N-terminal domain
MPIDGGIGTGSSRRRLGDLLLDEGILSEPSLERALAAQKRAGSGIKLGGVLLGRGLVSEEALLDALSRAHRCPAVPWTTLSGASPEAVALLTGARASRLGAFPYALEKRMLRVAFADPSNIAALDEVAAVTGYRVVPAVTCQVRLMQAHEKFYGRRISRQFSNILHRMESPRLRIRAPRPAAPPPPPPRFSAPELDDADLAGGQPPPEALSDAVPPAAFPYGAPASDNPYGEGNSRIASLADALDSGSAPLSIRANAIDITAGEAGEEEEEEEEEIPLDLGDPLPDSKEAESAESSDATSPEERGPTDRSR